MHITKTTLSFMVAAVLATSPTLVLAQTCNPNIPKSNPDSRYSYDSAGNEVTDSVTGLTWKRCVEGMSWSGSGCTGAAREFTWEAALAHASTQSGWRVPNFKELTSLVEDACYDMAINEVAFPGSQVHAWSASPFAASADYAWSIHFYYGHDDGYWLNKNNTLSVRLVRSQ